MKLLPLLWALALPCCLLGQPLAFPTTPPTDSKAATKTFHILDGFEMQLLAAEPLVTDPVAMTYDEDGRAYVCEMNDYPYTDKATHKPSQENPTDQPLGKVHLLEDTNSDGVFDKSTLFADHLSWPTGVACWKGGIFVTATPDVWYLKDTDGDGQADVRQKVFTGFKKLNVQAVMNNPAWGLDHRLYVAGGSNGATITRPDTPNIEPVSIRRHDFSFDPNSLEVAIESGGARFGNSFDDWGNRFLCNIRNPCQQVLLPYRFLSSNPYLTLPGALHDCAEAGDQLPVYRTSPAEPWREFRAKRWTAEGSHLPKSELVGAGVVTSSAGITIYRGDAYPPSYRDFAFVADVAGNLLYRMKLIPDGLTFNAVQVDGHKNFFTSDDLWCRPVNFVNAPDGCLHVCDMYREVIEHPWSIPDDIHAGLDLLRGTDKGRIWRLSPPAFKPRATPRLSKASTAELVALLDHPNAWHRDTAHRLLFEHQDKSAIPLLLGQLREAHTPQGRIGALWSLEGLGYFGPGATVDFKALNRIATKAATKDPQRWLREAGMTQESYGVLLEAVQDPSPEVRKQAVRMRPEALLAPRDLNEIYTLRTDAKRLLGDPDQAVRIEALLNHSILWSPAAFPRFTELCIQDDQQPQVLQAVLLACAESSFTVFQEVLKSPKTATSQPLQQFLCDAAAMMGRAWRDGDPNAPYHAMNHLILRGPPDALALRIVSSLASGLKRGNGSLDAAALRSFRESHHPTASDWMQKLQALAKQSLASETNSPEERSQSLAILPHLFGSSVVLPLATPFLSANQAPELQAAALESIATYRDDPTVSESLISAWKSLSPAMRDKALSAFLTYPDRTEALLTAIESKEIPASQINTSTRMLLTKHKSPGVASRSSSLLGGGTNEGRAQVIQRYAQTVLSAAPADAAARVERGSRVYQTVCIACHKHGSIGNDVGPHLSTVQGWTEEQLLTNILDPNREVTPNFALYILETKDGRTLSGIITGETTANLTLKRADGGIEEVSRSDIKTLASTGTSLMPEGLEAVITPAQMADLIAFLKAP